MAGPLTSEPKPPAAAAGRKVSGRVREPRDVLYSVLLFAYAALTYVLLTVYLPDPGHARCAAATS